MKRLIQTVAAVGALAACAAQMPTDAPTTRAFASPSSASEARPAAGIAGRWGVTAEACAASNTSRDGVIEISGDTIQLGLDMCAISAQASAAGGSVIISLDCKGSEIGEYRVGPVFVSVNQDTLTWTQKEDDVFERYIKCP